MVKGKLHLQFGSKVLSSAVLFTQEAAGVRFIVISTVFYIALSSSLCTIINVRYWISNEYRMHNAWRRK